MSKINYAVNSDSEFKILNYNYQSDSGLELRCELNESSEFDS